MQKYFKKVSLILLNNLIRKSFLIKQSNVFLSSKVYFSTNVKAPIPEKTIDENRNIDYIESGVFEVLKGAAKCKLDKLSRTATLEDLGFDSLDIVELVIAVEEKFTITISGK